MVSFVPARPSERYVPGTGPVRVPERAAHARAQPAPDDASLTLGRRVGVVVVLAVLAGAIVLAATGGRRDDRPGGVVVAPTSAVVAAATTPVVDPAATPSIAGTTVSPPTGQPAFVAPASDLVRSRRVTLRVRVPDPGVPWDGLRLSVMRGGTEVRSQSIGETDVNAKGRVTVRNVPLKRGTNRLTVALANDGGSGPTSDPISIRLDDQPPRLKVTAPRAGAVLNDDVVTVRGRTVAGVRVVIRNVTTDQKVETIADGSGSFEAQLGLKRGRDTIKVAVSDAAGNQNVEQFAIVRGNGKAEARLALSRSSVRHSALPRTIDAKVTVLDANGRPIKGADVVFIFAPPGPPTQTREMTTTKDGVAAWSHIRIVQEAVVGTGLLSVVVTLPDGRTLRDTQDLEITGKKG